MEKAVGNRAIAAIFDAHEHPWIGSKDEADYLTGSDNDILRLGTI